MLKVIVFFSLLVSQAPSSSVLLTRLTVSLSSLLWLKSLKPSERKKAGMTSWIRWVHAPAKNLLRYCVTRRVSLWSSCLIWYYLNWSLKECDSLMVSARRCWQMVTTWSRTAQAAFNLQRQHIFPKFYRTIFRCRARCTAVETSLDNGSFSGSNGAITNSPRASFTVKKPFASQPWDLQWAENASKFS